MFYNEKAVRSAMYISDTGEAMRLKRIPFMSNSFNESWLQELLAANPSLVPADEVGSEYGPLVCIGREVPVGSGDTQGYIDNLYVTPSGKIVIVETKLFRNQESRRTVVAQIIDYAKELQQWDAEHIDDVCSEYYYDREGQASRVIDVMAKAGYLTYSDEARLTDSINSSLESSSFLLLIIGDGIRSSVQQLADFLNDNASMHFNLALAEMEIYQFGEGFVVVPYLLTKTTIIERYTMGGYAPPSIISERSKKQYDPKPVLSRQVFIDTFAENGGFDADKITEFVCDLEAVDGISVGIAPTELTLRFSLDGSASYPLLTFGISGGHADVWMQPSVIDNALERNGIFPSEVSDYFDFYKQFISLPRCKSVPYEKRNAFYYANVGKAIEHSEAFISAFEHFLSSIEK